METGTKTDPTIFIIFGAAGNLIWRKLVPALYSLYLEKWIPDNFAIIGVGHTKITPIAFQKRLREGVDKFSRQGKSKKADWEVFEKYFSYQKGEFNSNATYSHIEKEIRVLEKRWKVISNCIFYLAVLPLPGRKLLHGRAGLINSGGASEGKAYLKKVMRNAVINKRAGGMGVILGRKSFQRPMKEEVELLHAIQDVYLDKQIDVA